jgi:hypothetical protein
MRRSMQNSRVKHEVQLNSRRNVVGVMDFFRKEETLSSGDEVSKIHQIVDSVQVSAKKHYISHQRVRQIVGICKAYFLFVQLNPESSIFIELTAFTPTSYYENGGTGPSTQLFVKSEAKTIKVTAIRNFRGGNGVSNRTTLKITSSSKDTKLLESLYTPKIGRLIEPFIEFLQVSSISFNGSNEIITLEADCLSTKPISL